MLIRLSRSIFSAISLNHYFNKFPLFNNFIEPYKMCTTGGLNAYSIVPKSTIRSWRFKTVHVRKKKILISETPLAFR